ncbi:MAG: hypothetical protein AAFX08_00255 [Pseudomonadota bacterium]
MEDWKNAGRKRAPVKLRGAAVLDEVRLGGVELSDAQKLAYIGEMLMELDALADQIGHGRLRFLLKCACEAAQQPPKFRRPSGASTS